MNTCYKSNICLVNLTIIKHFSHVQVIFMSSTQHVYNINTSRTTWKLCHVYRVNRGCPRGHMLVTHWSKNALLRNLPGESKRATRWRCGVDSFQAFNVTVKDQD